MQMYWELFRKSLLRFFLILLVFHGSVGAQDTLHVHDNIYVPSNEVLEINAGTVVFFHGYYHILLEGGLNVAGEETVPVIFTAADTTGLSDTYQMGGGWNGIRVVPTPDRENPLPVVIEYGVFEFSKASVLDHVNGGALSIAGRRDVSIVNSVFRNNYAFRFGGAIYLEENDANISHSHFLNNTAQNDELNVWAYGGAIYTVGSRCEISWSLFEGNFAYGMGGAMNFEQSSPKAFNNIIRNNSAPLGGGLGLIRGHSHAILSNNLIVGNTAEFFGGGIAFVDASIIVANSSILNNYAGAGGGLYFNEISNPSFYNCIVRDNWSYQGTPSQVWIWDMMSGPSFLNCNIQDGFEGFYGPPIEEYDGEFIDNIDMDPLFVDPDAGNYELQENSPCVDAGYAGSEELGIHGVDLSGNGRFSGPAIDIGPFEFQDPYNYFTVSISMQGQGQIIPEPGEYIMREGVAVALHAEPDSLWVFYHWQTSDGVYYLPELEYTITSDASIQAVFGLETQVNDGNRDKLMVYPNPFSSELTLKLPGADLSKESVFEFFDPSGRLILKRNPEGYEVNSGLRLDLSWLENGIYLVRFTSGNKVYQNLIIKE